MKNLVILIGNLGSDPEIRYTTSGTPVASLSVATTEKWKSKDGQMQEQTEWHRVVLWNKLAELAGEYLSKGSKIYLEGKIQTRSWEDQSEQKKYTTEIVGRELKFLSAKREGSGGGNQGFQEPPPMAEDVPF